MSEAKLKITPVIAPSGKAGLRKLGVEGRQAGRQIERSFTRAERRVERFDRTVGMASRGLDRMNQGARGLLGTLGSMKALAATVVVGGAGKTIFDGLIGSNAKLESQSIVFRAMLGDAEKADAAMKRISRYAANTPFSKDELIDGSKRLLRLTGTNIDENMKLLRLASQMKALSPDKMFSDAAEALLDAEGLEFERMKEFGIKLKKSDIKKIKKQGETLGQAALRGVAEQMGKMTGGRDPVKMLSQGFEGKVSTLKDNIKETFRVAGEPAFDVFKEGLDDIGKDFEKLRADPQFKQDMKDLGAIAADVARSSVKIARDLPAGIKQVRDAYKDIKDFVSEHETGLKVAGGLYAANKISGGALGRGVMGGARRLIAGRGGRAGQAVGGALGAAGATPVYVVNMGEGGMGGGGDFFKKGGAGALGKGALGGAGSAGQGALAGAGGVAGATVAAGAAIAVGIIAQPVLLAHVTGRTGAIVRRFEERERAARAKLAPKRMDTLKDVVKEEDSRTSNQRRLVNTNAERLAKMFGTMSSGAFKRNLTASLGGSQQVYQGTDFQKAQVEAINKSLASKNISFQPEVGKRIGDGRFSNNLGATNQRLGVIDSLMSKIESAPPELQARFGGQIEDLERERAQLGRYKQLTSSAVSHLNEVKVESGAVQIIVNGEHELNNMDLAATIQQQLEELSMKAMITSPGG